MINNSQRSLRALTMVAAALVVALPDCLRNHRPDKPKFTGHRRQTGGILSDIKQFDAERHYHRIIGCPHDKSSEWP